MSTHSSTRATTHHPLSTCHLRLLGADWGSDLSPCREKKVSHFPRGTCPKRDRLCSIRTQSRKFLTAPESSGKRQSPKLGGFSTHRCWPERTVLKIAERVNTRGFTRAWDAHSSSTCVNPIGNLGSAAVDFLLWPCTGSRLVLGQGVGGKKAG